MEQERPTSAVSRRRVITGSAAGIGTLVLPAAATAASGEGSGSGGPVTTTQTFSADGTFTVPAGVTQLTVRAEGTAGGFPSPTSIVVDTNATAGSYSYETLTFKSGTPGAGGDTSATVYVTPGETLNIVVGGSASSPNYTAVNDGTSSLTFRGGNGGMGIGVRSGSTWLLVACGGGGAGIGGFNYNSGDGGYFTVTNDYGGNGGDFFGRGSDGASQDTQITAGDNASGSFRGLGGQGFSVGPFNGNGSNGTTSTGTTLGAGGAVSANGALRGGAGGSGYAGGGGGGSDNTSGSGAGGGPGSNYYDVARCTVSNLSLSTRSLADLPLLTISYTV